MQFLMLQYSLNYVSAYTNIKTEIVIQDIYHVSNLINKC